MMIVIKAIPVALVAATLLVGAAGSVAADCPSGHVHTWDGGATDDNRWTIDANWDGNPEHGPSSLYRTACLTLDDIDDLCEYDTYLGNIAWSITIFGEFPTYFTFNIQKDICPSSFDLQEYASLDIDDCVDTGNTNLSGRIKIDVASGIDACLGTGDVEDESARIDLTGQIKFTQLTIDAETATQNISLTLDDGGTLLADDLEIRAETRDTWTARSARLNLDDGQITTNELHIWAGQANDRRVAFDLDDSITVRNKTTIDKIGGGGGVDGGGRVFIDVLIGTTLDLGELYIDGPCILKVTGIGLPGVMGQVVTSANEAAAANTCSCTCS